MRREHAKPARAARKEQPPVTQGARGLCPRAFYREAATQKPRKSAAFVRMMPKVGLEPTRGCPHRILSPARLPVPPFRPIVGVSVKVLGFKVNPLGLVPP